MTIGHPPSDLDDFFGIHMGRKRRTSRDSRDLNVPLQWINPACSTFFLLGYRQKPVSGFSRATLWKKKTTWKKTMEQIHHFFHGDLSPIIQLKWAIFPR